MAHFAELDENKIIKRIINFSNEEVNANGGELSVEAENFVAARHGGTWKQTSYNNNFRKQYAVYQGVYDEAKDKFISPKLHASWSLNANDDWQAPVTYPTITTYGSNDPLDTYFISWNEENLKWTATDQEGVYAEDGTETTPPNNFNWDASALAWVSA